MQRRQFAATLTGAAAALVLPRTLLARTRGAAPVIDGARLNARLMQLATFGARTDGGVDRVAYTAADLAAREWIAPLLRDAGLVVRRDTTSLVGAKVATRHANRSSLARTLTPFQRAASSMERSA
jgi:hypothetical protein